MKPCIRYLSGRALGVLALSVCVFLSPAARAADGPFALGFDGVNDYVSVPHSTIYNGYQLTVTAWIKTSQTSGEAGLVNKYAANSFNGWNLFLYNGNVRAWYFRDNANYIWDGTRGLNGGFVADGQWHHIAFVVNNTEGRLYVDGLPWDARFWDGTAGSATTAQEVRLGSYPGSGFYNGSLDEVTVWSRALGAPEISNLRSNVLVTEDFQSRGLFRITEGNGTTTRNSAYGRPDSEGTLVNGVTWVPGLVLKPGVMTQPPLGVANGSGRLRGLGSAGGTNAVGWFEWGTTTNYGSATPAQSLGAGTAETNFIHILTGLAAGTTIHYRAVASNALGSAFGADASFTPQALSLTMEREGHTTTLLPDGRVLVTGGYGASINFTGFPTNSAEVFDPSTGLWTLTSRMANVQGAHTATLLQNGKVLVVGGSVAELYDPVRGTWTNAPSPQAFHTLHTATLLQNGKVLIAGGFGNFPELYDPATGAWMPTGLLKIPRHRHTASLLPNGKVLISGGETNGNATASAELYDPASGTWTNTGSLNAARRVHTATLLINGQVLAVGGSGNSTYLSSSDRYNPATGTWSFVGEPLVHARGYHTATLLPRGAVLIVGGYPAFPSTAEVLEQNSDVWQLVNVPLNASRWNHTATLLHGGKLLLVGGYDENTTPIASVELYDVHAPTWSLATPMVTARYAHTSTPLPDGRVLVAGYGNTEIYSLTNGGWFEASQLSTPRASHTATLLPNGRVLVAGGTVNTFDALASGEMFNPLGFWMPTGPMTTNRSSHTATLLPNGKVLIAGGVPSGFSPIPFSTAELFDPTTGQWTRTGSLRTNRVGHSATLLPSGRVLVAGGSPDNFTVNNSVELYDFASETWTPVAPMNSNRSGHRATLLPNGTVLVTGGIPSGFGFATSSSEVFDPATGTWSFISSMIDGRQNHTATLLPNGRVLVVGGYSLGYVSAAEYYDPATRSWSQAGGKAVGTYSHAATLLPNGRVLVTGGWNGGGGLNSAELFDNGLGFMPVWQPFITNSPSQLAPGASLALGGFRFRGVSGASSGRDKDSPSDHPIVQLRALEGERTTFLMSTNWSTNTFNSLPVTGVAPGWAMATLFVNGMPSASSRLIEITAAVPTAPRLTDPVRMPNGSFRFDFTNSIGALFGALVTTNVSLPSSNWTPLGLVSEITPGRFQFIDPQATNRPRSFYRARSL